MEEGQNFKRLGIDAELKRLDEFEAELNQCVGLNKWLRRKKHSLKELIGLLREYLINYKKMPPDIDLTEEELKTRGVVMAGLKTLPDQIEAFKKRAGRGY
jgi:hypothetical protein